MKFLNQGLHDSNEVCLGDNQIFDLNTHRCKSSCIFQSCIQDSLERSECLLFHLIQDLNVIYVELLGLNHILISDLSVFFLFIRLLNESFKCQNVFAIQRQIELILGPGKIGLQFHLVGRQDEADLLPTDKFIPLGVRTPVPSPSLFVFIDGENSCFPVPVDVD